MRDLIGTLFIVACSALFCGCRDGTPNGAVNTAAIRVDSYRKLQRGMPRIDVQWLLGPPSLVAPMTETQPVDDLKHYPHGWFRIESWGYPFDINYGKRLPRTEQLVERRLWRNDLCAIEVYFDAYGFAQGAGCWVPAAEEEIPR